jgi:hypothetical protein
MTIPNERYRAVEYTRDFLDKILSGQLECSEETQKEAERCARHFPWPSHMAHVAAAVPEIFGSDADATWLHDIENFLHLVATDYLELSHDKIKWQRNDYRRRARKLLGYDDEK